MGANQKRFVKYGLFILFFGAGLIGGVVWHAVASKEKESEYREMWAQSTQHQMQLLKQQDEMSRSLGISEAEKQRCNGELLKLHKQEGMRQAEAFMADGKDRPAPRIPDEYYIRQWFRRLDGTIDNELDPRALTKWKAVSKKARALQKRITQLEEQQRRAVGRIEKQTEKKRALLEEQFDELRENNPVDSIKPKKRGLGNDDILDAVDL